MVCSEGASPGAKLLAGVLQRLDADGTSTLIQLPFDREGLPKGWELADRLVEASESAAAFVLYEASVPIVPGDAVPANANFVKRSEHDDGSRWLIYEARERAGSFIGIALGSRTVLYGHGLLGTEYVGLEISVRDRAGLGDAYAIVASCGPG